MTSCTREELVSLLTMCCLQSQPEQICPVNRIISNEMCIELCKKEEKAIRDCCNSICSENNTFMKIFDQVSLYKSKIHSEWFSTNQGNFVMFIFLILNGRFIILCNVLINLLMLQMIVM